MRQDLIPNTSPCSSLSSVLRVQCFFIIPIPVASEISVLCETSDLLLLVRYFAFQSKGIKFGHYFLMCVV